MIKSDLNNTTGVDNQDLLKKVNLAGSKSDIDEFNVDKL